MLKTPMLAVAPNDKTWIMKAENIMTIPLLPPSSLKFSKLILKYAWIALGFMNLKK